MLSQHTLAIHLLAAQEGKARLSAQPALVPQLVALLQPGCGEQLQCGVLRLLHNLSFDGVLRQQMMDAGLVQQVSIRLLTSRVSIASICHCLYPTCLRA